MDEHNLEALIAGAAAYEELLVPALFQEWTARLISATEIQPGHRVLDIACGTGVLARAAAARVTRSGAVIGLDPAPGMLAVAKRLAPEIEWRQGAAESLPFPAESFDIAVSQFGLMFFADRRQAIREMLRVVTSRGRIGVAVWDSLENIPAYAAEVALVQRIAGQRPADALRAPFSLGEANKLLGLLTSSGASRVSAISHVGTAKFPTLRSMVEADIFGWLPLMGVPLTQDESDEVLKEAENVLKPYVTADGSVEFLISAHIVTFEKA